MRAYGGISSDGTIKLSSVKLTLFDVQFGDWEKSLFIWYMSLKNDEDSIFGGSPHSDNGKCPNKKYRTTFKAEDSNGYEINDAEIKVLRPKTGKVFASIKSGGALYLYDGDYTAKVIISGKEVTADFKVDGAKKQVVLKQQSTQPPDPDTPDASGKCGDNAFWTLKDGSLVITGTGPMYDWYAAYSDSKIDPQKKPPWYSFKSEIKCITIENGITTIGNAAFQRWDDADVYAGTASPDLYAGLTTISLPETLTYIGDCAFRYQAITNITIPNSVTVIGLGAFSFSSLTEIEIPASVREINAGAFVSNSLRKVVFKGDVPTTYDMDPIIDIDNGITICYPANNSTWTEENKKWITGTAFDYDDTDYKKVTWVPVP